MQPNGHKLSAVARRRLLRETAGADPNPSAPSSTLVAEADPIQDATKRETTEEREVESEGDGLQTANQFSTLVKNSAVDFSSSREVEQLTERSVKIRLSRGQKCVVLGTCVLWIKQGSVSIYGAVLSASTAIYRIYAPSSHALPAIQATSIHVELQLESLNDGINALPSLGLKDMWIPAGVKPSATSFYVLGHSFEQDLKAPRRLPELDTYLWKTLLVELTDFGHTSPPRILISGTRSSGLSTLVRCIINRLLAKQLATSDKLSEKGVVLVDLDTGLPQFAPPGMISLVHVGSPVFGPPFASLLPSSQDASGQVLRQHFLGSIDKTELEDWHLARVHNLLDLQESLREGRHQLPEIVIVPKWLNDINENTASRLRNKISPSDIVCLDANAVIPHVEPWRSLVPQGNCRIHQYPVQALDRITAVRECDLQLQSYFHREDSRINRPFWDEAPVLATTRRTVMLSYGDDDAQICAIILLGGRVAHEDTYEAVHGSLVALVAVRAPEDRADEDGDLDMDSIDRGSISAYSKIRQTEEGLPRWQKQPGVESSFPFPAKDSFCLGLALVQEVDVPSRKIRMVTAPGLHMHDIEEQRHRIALVIAKATADGRLRTEWARQEMSTKKSGRRPD